MNLRQLRQYLKEEKLSRKISSIILHHAVSTDTERNNWTAIERFHKEVNNWSKIGYHFGIEKDNGELVYRVGRDMNEIGAHCRGNNSESLGICMVGNFDIDEPSLEKYFYLAYLCDELLNIASLNILNIKPHWNYNQWKTCPGARFSIPILRKCIYKIRSL